MNQTVATREQDIKRVWHLIDVNEKGLGRSATKIAELLMGKSKPYFVRNLDCGDYVVVINAKTVKTSGNKELQKVYYRHSGFPGGFRSETMQELRERRPDQVIYQAVKGMLPQNKLRDRMLRRLHVYAGAEYEYADKIKEGTTV